MLPLKNDFFRTQIELCLRKKVPKKRRQGINFRASICRNVQFSPLAKNLGVVYSRNCVPILRSHSLVRETTNLSFHRKGNKNRIEFRRLTFTSRRSRCDLRRFFLQPLSPLFFAPLLFPASIIISLFFSHTQFFIVPLFFCGKKSDVCYFPFVFCPDFQDIFPPRDPRSY